MADASTASGILWVEGSAAMTGGGGGGWYSICGAPPLLLFVTLWLQTMLQLGWQSPVCTSTAGTRL